MVLGTDVITGETSNLQGNNAGSRGLSNNSTQSVHESNSAGTPTESLQPSNSSTSISESATSNEATNYRTLEDIYANTYTVEL